jgi:hypothetical protein
MSKLSKQCANVPVFKLKKTQKIKEHPYKTTNTKISGTPNSKAGK